jgi:hypothetical protein
MCLGGRCFNRLHVNLVAKSGRQGLQLRCARGELRAAITAEVFTRGYMGTAYVTLSHLFHNVEAQKCFAYDDFIAIT